MFAYKTKYVSDEENQLVEFYCPSEPPPDNHGFPIPVSEDILLRDTVIQRFVVAGVDPTDPRYNVNASLHETALWGMLEMFWLFYKWGANIYSIGGEDGNRTLLHSAAIGGSVKILRFLIQEKGFDVHARDSQGLTPLHLAASQGNGAAIRLLAEHGADVDALDDNSWTPLHHLIVEGHDCLYANVRTLLELGADRGKGIGEDGKTALHLAIVYGRDMAIDILLDNGLDIEGRSSNGETPLYVAARKGLPTAIEMLIKRGADINTRNNEGQTLVYAAAAGEQNWVTVPVLLKYGFTIHSDLGNGKTLLQYLKDEKELSILGVCTE